jgi:hypothetical protein
MSRSTRASLPASDTSHRTTSLRRQLHASRRAVEPFCVARAPTSCSPPQQTIEHSIVCRAEASAHRIRLRSHTTASVRDKPLRDVEATRATGPQESSGAVLSHQQ